MDIVIDCESNKLCKCVKYKEWYGECSRNFPMESVLEKDIKKCLIINYIGLTHKLNKNLMNNFSQLCVINRGI